MKYFLLLFTVIYFSNETEAQIQKGGILIGGNINFNNQENNLQRIASGVTFEDVQENDLFTLQPQAGIFVSQSLLLGLGLEYEYQYFKDVSSRNDRGIVDFFSRKNNLMLLNVFLQNYFSLSDKFFFNPSINIMFGGGRGVNNGTNTQREDDLSALRLNIAPRLTYFVSENWAVNASFGQIFYNRLTATYEGDGNFSVDEENTGKSYGLDLSLNSLEFGIQYFLNNKPN